MSDRQRDPRVPRYSGTTWSHLAAADSRPLPVSLREDVNSFTGSEDLSHDHGIADHGIFNGLRTWFEGEIRAASRQVLGWIGRVPASGAAS